jgi:hypothetical protein
MAAMVKATKRRGDECIMTRESLVSVSGLPDEWSSAAVVQTLLAAGPPQALSIMERWTPRRYQSPLSRPRGVMPSWRVAISRQVSPRRKRNHAALR